MKSLFKLFVTTAFLALPCVGQSSGIPSSSSVAVYLQNSSGSTICSFLAASASYQVTAAAVTTGSTGIGTAKVGFGPLTIEKSVDNCSATLLADALSGTALPRLFIVVAPPTGSTGQPTFVIASSLSLITSFTDATSKTLKLEETVTFDYENLAVAEASNGTVVSSCTGFNASTNRADTTGCGAIATFLNSKPALPTTY